MPTAVFSSPEIGSVGLTELEARAEYPAVDVYKVRFRPLKAAVTGNCETALLKIVVDCATDRILGVHMVAEEACKAAAGQLRHSHQPLILKMRARGLLNRVRPGDVPLVEGNGYIPSGSIISMNLSGRIRCCMPGR